MTAYLRQQIAPYLCRTYHTVIPNTLAYQVAPQNIEDVLMILLLAGYTRETTIASEYASPSDAMWNDRDSIEVLTYCIEDGLIYLDSFRPQNHSPLNRG